MERHPHGHQQHTGQAHDHDHDNEHGHSHEHGHQHGRGHEGGHRHGLEGHHDWHSAHYVRDWIGQDVTRDEERRPLVRMMLARAPFDREGPVRVLDVGAGYGLLSEEVLRAYPKAQVTLQDFSAPMLERARERLAAHDGQTTYATADFSKPGWANALGGPFDFAVSGIAIHNLGDLKAMQDVYREVAGVIKPGGVFLDMDYIFRGLTPAMHAQWMREAGFTDVEVLWRDERRACFAAFK